MTRAAATPRPRARPALERYHHKRDFARTPEPRGRISRAKAGHSLGFFIQRHRARALHYDFRLELDGVLKSWAVPKGPSLDPADKRLAVRVEDHPLDYGSFEGTIPSGQYGAGEVVLWDRGTWIPEGNARDGLRKGQVKFTLKGKKLGGRWALVRMAKPDSKKENWLLIKERDDQAREGKAARITELEPNSVAKSPRSSSGGKKTQRGKPDGNTHVKVAGITLSHASRVLFPHTAITKIDLAHYYEAVAERMLPYLRDRPLAIVRCPQGGGEKCFFQKHAGQGMGGDIGHVEVAESHGKATYMTVDGVSALVGMVQMDVLELHTWGSRRGRLAQPDRIIFDLDPAPDVEWEHLATAARLVRGLLQEIGLTSFAKTTGGKGLHVVAPIRPRHEWSAIKAFTRAIAEHLEQTLPDHFISRATKSARDGRIFVDYLRNAEGATAIAEYSTRARPNAPVAIPIGWDELTPELRSDSYTVSNLPQRLEKLRSDPWADYFDTRQNITAKMLKAF
jgi:bifunctional non-homologous end joining protein LigD